MQPSVWSTMLEDYPMRYMIERRYGSRPNRDWLAAYGPGDKSTTWVCGPVRAETYSDITTARLMLDRIQDAAEAWDNRDIFTFHVIEDRRNLPTYFLSTDA